MLSAASLLRLPYETSLTLAGIEYAKKSLRYTYNRMHLNPGARLRKIAAGIAVELAFQRWLETNAVPFDRLGLTAFTEKDKYDLALGGRRCDVKSFLISHPRKRAAVRDDPAVVLEASALVPEDQLRSDSLQPNDLYVFGFLAAHETRSPAEAEQALRAGQRVYWLYPPAAETWAGTQGWRMLEQLALKSKADAPVTVEVGGQDTHRAAFAETLTLPPRTRTPTHHEFFSLLYLHTPQRPTATLGVSSPAIKEVLLVEPGEWLNIWVYGEAIVLAGWLTKGEFRAQSERLPAGSAVWQYPKTQTDNRAVPVHALRPIEELVALVKNSAWGKK